jgi:hypothetical protein
MKSCFAILLASQLAPAADLNIRHVILYKHGVAYYERAGALQPGESARLDFRAEDMNDILKSLTVEVTGGKGVAGLRYDSSKPLETELKEYPIQLERSAPLVALLDQFRGSLLEVKWSEQTLTGTIISARVLPATRDQSEKQEVTLLLDTEEMRAIEIPSVSAMRFLDPKLQEQLRDYLSVFAKARNKERRSVYIDSVDNATRQVSVRYMAPAPVWKSSYRLIFPGSGEPLLEGWAIVDNDSGEAWNGVRLALVSGRPVSFISNLYPPRYVERPVMELPEERAGVPQIHGGAVGAVAESVAAPAADLRARREMAMLPPPAPGAAPKAAPSSFDVTAATREAGELFEYSFAQAVTVPKDGSAMLPFLQQRIPARKLLIYSDTRSPHPRNAVELSNSSGKTLDGGPVTVFDGDAYAGEALFETMKAGDKRLISYAVDLGTRITTAFGSGETTVREVHFRRGVLTAKSAIREKAVYTIHNVDQKPKTLVIERPVRSGYEVISPKPSELTTEARRFEVRLAPGATQKLEVVEENIQDQRLIVANLTPEQLISYTQNKEISATARRELERMASLKRQLAEADVQMRQTQSEIDEMFKDQQRVRENLSSLNRVAGQQEQVQRYARELAEQESRLASLRDRMAELRKRKAALETELNDLLEKAEF